MNFFKKRVAEHVPESVQVMELPNSKIFQISTTEIAQTDDVDLAPPPAPPVYDFEMMLKDIQSTKPVQLEHEIVDLKGYDTISHSLGYMTPELAEIIVKNFCRENDIPLYDMNEVIAYMDKVVALERIKQKETHLFWYWRGLTRNDGSRDSDHKITTQFNHVIEGNTATMLAWHKSSPHSYHHPNLFSIQSFHTSGDSNLAPYDKSIPLYVLSRAKKIMDHFAKNGEKTVNFTVSDYQVQNPDPFMMGEYHGYKFVFAVWDEPTFGI